MTMTSSGPPVITVIMATWGRGRHVLPSIQSVLRQGFRDFELLVIGDACNDETEAAIGGISDPRLRWINLTQRVGSQSGPNNAGIAAAQGQIIAYLGHDDIWEPFHLEEIAKLFHAESGLDFAVSGVICHLPKGLPGSLVMGLFAQDADKHRFFFPPSCFAHRKSVVDRIGDWRMPLEVRPPVDEEFLLRAVAADMRFQSTGRITVHKFTAGDRYLIYLRPESHEQSEMLADLNNPTHQARMDAIVRVSRRMGRYMIQWKRDYQHLEPGERVRLVRATKGISRPAPRPLGRGTTIRHRPEPSAHDWLTRPILGIRFHGRNPAPRQLLPFTATTSASLSFRAVHPDRHALETLKLDVNDQPATLMPISIRRGLWGWTARYETLVALDPVRPSLIEFDLTPGQCAKTMLGRFGLGFGIGPLRLSPTRKG